MSPLGTPENPDMLDPDNWQNQNMEIDHRQLDLAFVLSEERRKKKWPIIFFSILTSSILASAFCWWFAPKYKSSEVRLPRSADISIGNNVYEIRIFSIEKKPLVIEKLIINGQYQYEFLPYTIAPNDLKTGVLSLIRFADNRGNRFRPLEQKPIKIEISGKVGEEEVIYRGAPQD